MQKLTKNGTKASGLRNDSIYTGAFTKEDRASVADPVPVQCFSDPWVRIGNRLFS
jgi:hypothetical protein